MKGQRMIRCVPSMFKHISLDWLECFELVMELTNATTTHIYDVATGPRVNFDPNYIIFYCVSGPFSDDDNDERANVTIWGISKDDSNYDDETKRQACQCVETALDLYKQQQ